MDAAVDGSCGELGSSDADVEWSKEDRFPLAQGATTLRANGDMAEEADMTDCASELSREWSGCMGVC